MAVEPVKLVFKPVVAQRVTAVAYILSSDKLIRNRSFDDTLLQVLLLLNGGIVAFKEAT